MQNFPNLRLAIVSIDLVGYSRLMEEDERGTHRALMTCLDAKLRPFVSCHGGHIVKLTGDGALVTFSDVPCALESMVAFQRGVKKGEAGFPLRRRFSFRVGIHFAGTIPDQGDLYGHGVNVAVRLQEAAVPETILLSDAAMGRLPEEQAQAYGIVSLGCQTLKKLKNPISIHFWQGRTERRSKSIMGMITTRSKNAMGPIAIGLSLVMLTYINQGPWEEEVHPLSKSPDEVLEVATLSSKGGASLSDVSSSQATDPPGQFSGHNVEQHVLTHSIISNSAASRLRGQTVFQLFNPPPSDLSHDVSKADLDHDSKSADSKAQLFASPGQRGVQSRREIAEELCMRAWMFYSRNTPSDYAEAFSALKEALALDHEHDEAHALLSAVYWKSWQKRWPLGTGETAVRTLKLAEEHLIKVRTPSAVAHVVKSEMLTASGRHAEAIAEAERAMLLEPAMAVGYHAKGLALHFDGRPEQAEALIQTARQLDPDVPGYLLGLAFAQFNQNRFEEAFSTLSQATAVNLHDDWAFLLLAATSGFLGRHQDARHALGRFDRLSLGRRGWFANQIPYVYGWPFKKGLDQERVHTGMILAGISPPLKVIARH